MGIVETLKNSAGMVDGSFYATPKWVDQTKPPGHTSQATVYPSKNWWYPMVTGTYLFLSPNFVWLMISLGIYLIFPFDLVAAKTWQWDWVLYRAKLNTAVTLVYFGWWHVTLYLFNFSKRPFNRNRRYRIGKLLHNVWYTTLGALQWTLWECVFMYCYATGRLPYISNAEAFSTPGNIARTVGWVFLVPLWRSLHFYLAHRFIHMRVLYKYVHSLHHRNTDIEPFAGLCMHPVEHLYYYTCAYLPVFFTASPFAVLWSGMHAVISPAASHSGWEDNWQSDQYHYLHHRFFECNYGTPDLPFDSWFGTFRDKLDSKGRSATYKGQAEANSDEQAMKMDAKADLLALPNPEDVVYNLTFLAILAAFGAAVLRMHGMHELQLPGVSNATLMGLLVSLGPVLVGALMLFLTSARSVMRRLRFSYLFPFHKEALAGAFGLHILLAMLVVVFPLFAAVHTAVAAPGDSIHCQIWADC